MYLFYDRLVEFAQPRGFVLAPGIRPHQTQQFVIVRLMCQPPKVIARTQPNFAWADAYVRDVYSSELTLIWIVDLFTGDIHGYSSDGSSFLTEERAFSAGGKRYDIDTILASNDAATFAQTLFRELSKTVPLRNDSEGNVCSAWACDSEVHWNGFEGWFLNSAALILREAKIAFAAIGASRRGELLVSAMQVFPSGEPPEDESYVTILENLSPEEKARLETLSEEFCSLKRAGSPEDLPALLHAYVTKHIRDFS